ncbi:MAG: alpha-D-ribose 1-methylphosphonate 5-triphosphate diphosphatase [Roseobacter sp.]
MQLKTIQGATVYLPTEIVETNVTISGENIIEIGGPAQGDVIDGRGLILAPALIDVHGDAFERQLMPRPGVFFPSATALLETDRQLAANGIATAYHALTLGFEPGLRSVARGREIIQSLRDLTPRLNVENRIQLRWETFAFEAVDLIMEAMNDPLKPALAFNDHLSMAMRAPDLKIQDRLFEHDPEFPVIDMSDETILKARQAKHAIRAGLEWDAYRELVAQVWARREHVPQRMRDLATYAKAKGVPMLSHDDTQQETRRFYDELGASVCEFPMTMDPVKEARRTGGAIVFGAPNALRGGSHIGSLAAGDMVEAGYCDVLASDYYYPAMLAAVDKLDRENRADRLALWSLISRGPAQAMQLHDRGEITVGRRADLVLVDWPTDSPPAIVATWVAGRAAYRAHPAG